MNDEKQPLVSESTTQAEPTSRPMPIDELFVTSLTPFIGTFACIRLYRKYRQEGYDPISSRQWIILGAIVALIIIVLTYILNAATGFLFKDFRLV